MNTKRIGDASEARVLSALLERDYPVSVPFGDNDPYDLLVETSDGVHRVQVKTGWMEEGRIRFKTASKTTADGNAVRRDYAPEEVDVFAVRCRETDDCYWVPFETAGRKNTYLRVDSPKIDHPNVRLAEDYRFDTALPPR
ncbi:group I intron-associated PD-(D/E)XK endonuclease [Natronomonas sp.]|uniref:group I intron-associated PD-(D/E)XK endonuclease n=1 Tax=Natronomonas sp. TaxID=2184060 RepID=UPI002FC283FA